MRLKISLALVLAATGFYASAQQSQHVASCSDNAIHAQLVSTDGSLEQQGFNLVQFMMMSMPSGAYVPVTVSMEQGLMYQINFVASKNFQNYTFTVLDKDRNKIVDKKVKQKDGSSNQLSQSFAAPYTGNYIVIVTQKVKGQPEACGGFSVLKAVNDHLPARSKK